MSNQRRGKWKPAALNDGGQTNDMALVQFFKSAKESLEQYGESDAAFYFEQCEDWIRSGKSLSSAKASVVLGV